jgi:hypothetical protein
MKLTLGTALFALGCSMFCGIIIIGIGFGAAFPVINTVAAPFVCSGKELRNNQQSYSYQPGEVTTTITWYCVDTKTGAKEDVTLQTNLAAGVIYGLITFAIFIVWWLLANRPGQNPARSATIDIPPVAVSSRPNTPSEGALKRLTELKEMRDSDLITQDEYEKKKAEILESL